jgi:hypothetical protein
VPQRINYVLWIEDLIQRADEANGIDIGKIIFYLDHVTHFFIV